MAEKQKLTLHDGMQCPAQEVEWQRESKIMSLWNLRAKI